MNVKIKSRNQVQIKRWSAQSGNSYDAPNPNVVLIGFEAIIPAGEEAQTVWDRRRWMPCVIVLAA